MARTSAPARDEVLMVTPSEIEEAVVTEVLSYFDGSLPGSYEVPRWRAEQVAADVLARLCSRRPSV